MTSNPVKEEAVTEAMLRAGMAAFGATELVGSSFTPRAIRSAYLAMRQADPRIAELKAALEEIEKRCHSETRQGLLAICHAALGIENEETP